MGFESILPMGALDLLNVEGPWFGGRARGAARITERPSSAGPGRLSKLAGAHDQGPAPSAKMETEAAMRSSRIQNALDGLMPSTPVGTLTPAAAPGGGASAPGGGSSGGAAAARPESAEDYFRRLSSFQARPGAKRRGATGGLAPGEGGAPVPAQPAYKQLPLHRRRARGSPSRRLLALSPARGVGGETRGPTCWHARPATPSWRCPFPPRGRWRRRRRRRRSSPRSCRRVVAFWHFLKHGLGKFLPPYIMHAPLPPASSPERPRLVVSVALLRLRTRRRRLPKAPGSRARVRRARACCRVAGPGAAARS